MPDKVAILKESGETLNSTIVSIFSIPESDKKYMITTENAVDPHGLTVLHVSELSDGILQRVATDEEWSSIKTIMRAIISGNVGSYQYLPVVENVNASGQYSRDISVSATAAKQMIDSYANGDKSVVNNEPQPEASEPILNIGSNNQVPVNNPSPVPDNNINNQAMGVNSMGVGAVPVAPVANGMPSTSGDASMLGSPTGTQVSAATITPDNMAMSNGVVAPNIDLTPDAASPSVASPMSGIQDSTMTNIPPVDMNGPMAPALPLGGGVQMPPSGVVNNEIVNPSLGLNNDVQSFAPVTGMSDGVVAPEVNGVSVAQNVPEGQIVQPSLDGGANPSFAPDASLDSVVIAAQEMFIEGVKNLVQTIQEKVYRDLYTKENEINKREVMVSQREKLLNEQMMLLMNNNFSAMQMQQTSQQTNPGMMMNNNSFAANPMFNQQGMMNQNQQVNTQPMNMMNNQGQNPVTPMTPFVPTVVQASNDTAN